MLSETGCNTALAAVLPNGTNRYVALLTAIPTAKDGTGMVEATGSGYARKAHSAWLDTTDGDAVYRVNDGAITFAALSADLDAIVGWAIYDASTSGNLLAYGPLLDVGGVEVEVDFASGDEPRFVDQQLRVGLE
jgi:hypothetical protein